MAAGVLDDDLRMRTRAPAPVPRTTGARREPPAAACAAPSSTETFVDLGMSPPCESYLAADQLDGGETFYPLHVRICSECLLVQLPAYIAAEDIFSHYAYFSSFSDSWVAHAGRYVGAAVERLGLGASSFVVEVASNDGYLLQHVVAKGIRALGIEPAANVAEAAVAKGIPTEVLFLGEETGAKVAAEHGQADLVVANNVFAHVPDIVDFSQGLRALLADDGRVTIEIPHLLRLIEGRQYDTIYHEHYSYLSLLTTQRVLAAAGLTVVDVEELPTHGGSLRTWSTPDRVGARSDPGGRRRAGGRGRGGARHARGPRRLRGRGGRGAQRPGRVPGGPVARGRARRRLRGAREGQHAAQPRGHPVRPAGLHGRPQPVQARHVPARARTSRSSTSTRSPPRGPTTS